MSTCTKAIVKTISSILIRPLLARRAFYKKGPAKNDNRILKPGIGITFTNMKNLLLPLFFMGGFIQANAQHTTIVENAQRSQYESTSYLVVGTLTLKPGFNFNSAQQGTFFARAHDNDPSIAPTEDRNFIRSEAVFKEGITTDEQVLALGTGDKSTSYNYSD